MDEVWSKAIAHFPEATHQYLQPLAQRLADNKTLPTAKLKKKDFLHVCFCSDYFSLWLNKEPHWLESRLAQFGEPIGEHNFYKALLHDLNEVKNAQELGCTLRCYRTQLMMQIIWRDILGLADLKEVMQTLSTFADVCLESSVKFLHQNLSKQMGLPINHAGKPMSLIVLALGKLGGKELNLSSDIDLIMAYEHDGEYEFDGKTFTHGEFFSELTREINKVLSERTEFGFVFRVDLRLRPFGDSGPLAMSCSAMEQYYQEQGRDWERYAMIKARTITGRKSETKPLMKMLSSFVYRRYIDYSALHSLREMKAKIMQEVKSKGLYDNIKTGPGGIREIEFINQAYQLLQGGKIKRLQQRELLKTIRALTKEGIIKKSAAKHLHHGYVFLRTLEHRLQAISDQQTQRLPNTEYARLRLAIGLGYHDWANCSAKIEETRQAVQAQFIQLAEDKTVNYNKSSHDWHISILDHEQEKQRRVAKLKEKNIEDAEEIIQLLDDFYALCQRKKMSQIAWQRLQKLLPMVLALIFEQVQIKTTLIRLLDLLSSILKRSSYLLLLQENQKSLEHCVKLCSASAWFSDELSRYPMLLDELLDSRALYELTDAKSMQAQLQLLLAECEDTEERMHHLRQFKRSYQIKIAAAQISKVLPLMKVSDKLTELAEILVQEVLQIAWHDVSSKFADKLEKIPDITVLPFGVLAYGKLAGLELAFNSDLDIIFLYDREASLNQLCADETTVHECYSRLVQRIMHLMTTRTETGQLYNIDMRLRPSGDAGLLVCSLEAFAVYQNEQAWVWEHQALVRSRMICGTESMYRQFSEIRKTVLTKGHQVNQLKQDILEMREKMQAKRIKPGYFDLKLSRGGVTDIEFIVQFIVLRYAHAVPDLLTYPDNIRILEQALLHELIEQSTKESLIENYLFYREKGHLLMLQNQAAVIPIEDVEQIRDCILSIWQDLFAF